MATYTIDNSMFDLVCELSEREIYNDIRAEIGVTTSETIVDADTAYSWRYWDRQAALPAPGYTTFRYFTASMQDVSVWQLTSVSAHSYDMTPYYDYEITLIDTDDDLTKAVEIKNTGTGGYAIRFTVRYKYLSAEEITHEEFAYNTLQVRATDDTSISKYGRRVMNLQWPQGTEATDMQGIVDSDNERYKEPYARLILTMKGEDATKQAIIYGAEISDTMTVTCDKLGLTATDYFIDSIDINDNVNIPTARFELVAERTVESTGYFVIDTDFVADFLLSRTR